MIGIEKSLEKLDKSDLVICVFDSSNFDDEDKEILKLVKDKNTIYVYNKEDLAKEKDNDKLYVSALNKSIDPLKNEIIKRLGLSEENYNNPSIANTREIGILESVKKKLEDILRDTLANIPIDIINSEIQEVYLAILSLLGEDNDFDIAKEIFSRFCVGK